MEEEERVVVTYREAGNVNIYANPRNDCGAAGDRLIRLLAKVHKDQICRCGYHWYRNLCFYVDGGASL